ncbi:hypothetical protein [Flagellimonas sp.]|uniref:hypothetical protein n=1 Tax=Flagellimonas sp. TaxID=2058762 RepID=UPI003BB1875B
MKSKITSALIFFFGNYGLILGGLFMVLIGFIVMNKARTQMNLTEEGRRVPVEILKSPADCDRIGRRGGYCTLKFNGREIIKRTGHKFCELVEGKKEIVMLTNAEKSKLIFLNEYEKEHNWISGIGLCLFGIVITYKGWKQRV